jgi:predicted metal-dependent hydrolase
MGGPPPAEPSLDDEERRALAQGIAEFNAGLFFECHDTLEDLWGGIRGPARDFFQGLIQVAVAYYHLGNGNAAGAESMMRRAGARLGRYPPRYCGFDVEAQRAELARWLERFASGAGAATAADQPRWRFEGIT